MIKKTSISINLILILIIVLALFFITPQETYGAITKNTPFVTATDGSFYVGNDPFRFVGTNNYYLHYKDETMINAVLDDASEAGFSVIRMWGFLDGDSSSVVENKAWMQPSQGVFEEPAWANNEFVSAWNRMDYAVSEAAKRGIRVIIVLTNYWDDFGGISEYVGWYNQKYGYTSNNPNYAHKKDFYTNEEIKTYYKTYISHLISRTNSFNGRDYSEDPTIFAWELMNEPRNPMLDGGNINDVTLWADEMSTYIKQTLDDNHMIALGDEGSFNNREEWDYERQAQHIYSGAEGVDFEAILELDNIDFGTYHLYPESWGINHSHMEWGRKFIIDHINVGKEIGKPVILEEFGISASLGRNRELIYDDWLNAVYQNGGAGAMFWMYASTDTSENATDGGFYPDYDGFRLAEIPGKYPELDVLKQYAQLFIGNMVDFSDKIYVLSPYTTTQFKEIDGSLFDDQYYPIEVKVRTGRKVNRVEMFIDGDYYVTLDHVSTKDTYTHLFNLRHIYRGSNVFIDFKAYTNDDVIESESLEIRRLLKFDYFSDNEYTFSSQNGVDDVFLGHYGAPYNATFYDLSWSDFNGGAIKLEANYDKDHFWSEIKLEVTNLPKAVILDHYALSYDVYFEKDNLIEGVLKPTDEAYDTAPGFRHYAALDPGWAKIGLNENNVKYFDLDEVTIGGKTYIKQHVYINYNSNSNQSKLVLGIVTNHLLYEGDIYIDNLTFYGRILSSDALDEDDYIDWRLEREENEAAARQLQLMIIVVSSIVGVLAIGGVTTFVVIKKVRKTKLKT